MKKLVFFISLLIISISSSAQTQKIKELERQRRQTLLEVEKTNKLLNESKKTTATILDRLKLLSNQIQSRQKVVSLLEQEVNGITAEQKQIEADIVILEKDLKSQQASYKKAIDGMMKNRRSEQKFLFILSGRSLSESYRRMKYLREYSDWRSKQADEIKAKNEQLKKKQEELRISKANKVSLLGQRVTEQKNLKNEESSFEKEKREAQKKQGELQKILQKKRQQADALNKQIERLIAEEVARQEREAKRLAEEEAKRTGKTPSKGTVVTTPKSTAANITLSNNFASNKGKLPYPISGNSVIVTRFGTHKQSQYVTMSNNGIDIRSQAGAEALSVFNGEVTSVVAIPGYNYSIIIRHGNYYTFYGNIQNVYVKQGDKVKTGQSLGKVYSDPETNNTQIHFQLWLKTNKQNPETWLR